MSIRITQRLMTERSLTAMQISMERLARSQEQLSTGRQINRPSDSPTGANSAMRLREELAANAAYARNASDGLAWLGRTDSTLSTMVDGTRRARDILVQGSNTGALGPQARQALAAEMRQIRESMVALANTEHLGRPLFGGTMKGGAAYTADGTFQAPAARAVTRQVETGGPVAVSTLGPDAFGDGPDNLFHVLGAAAAALADPAQDPSAHLAGLDSVMDKMMTALADVGTRYGRVEKAQAAANDTTLDMQAMLSEVENVDIAKAIVDLQMQEVAYQAALGATARVIQPSLLDFLR